MSDNKIFKIVKSISTLSEKGSRTKELNLIKYRDLRYDVLDLRNWDNSDEDNKKMLKGITLTEDEAKELLKALTNYFKKRKFKI